MYPIHTCSVLDDIRTYIEGAFTEAPSQLGPAMAQIAGLVFVALLIALISRTVISWYIDGAASFLGCMSLLGMNVALLVAILVIPSMTVRVSLSLLLLAMLLLIPVIGRSLSDANHSSLDDDRMKSYRKAIRVDPNNLAARTKLSELLYNRGLLDDAIDELSIVMRANPGSVTDAHRLKRMLAEREERKAPPVKCPGCGQSNPSGRRQCLHCGSELSIAREFRNWLMRGGLKQVVVLSSATMLGIAMVLTFFSMLSWMGKVIIAGLILLIVISAEFLYIQRNW